MATPEPALPNPSAADFSYETSPHLYLFTSLTAGSSHIITATSRMETILKANRIPFYAIDTATDEKARRIWTRRSKGRKIPGLVKEGRVLGDIDQVEEWNEFGELKDVLLPHRKKREKPVSAAAAASASKAGASAVKKENESPAELKTGDAPAAPAMPPKDAEGKELPIRPKAAEPVAVAPTAARQESPKPSGQMSLAAEIAAKAQQRTRDKAAALKASVEAKQKESQKAGEQAEEKGGTPEKGAVEEALASAPAGGVAEGGESKVGGLEAVTDDPEGMKKEEEEAKKEMVVDAKATEDDAAAAKETSDAVPDREPVEHALDAAPAAKSGEEAVGNTSEHKDEQAASASSSTAVASSDTTPDRDPVDHALDAAPAAKSGEDAVTDHPKQATSSQIDEDATAATEASSTKPDRSPVDSALDAAPAAKSGDAAVTSHATSSPTAATPQADTTSKAHTVEEAVSADPVESHNPATQAPTGSHAHVAVLADPQTIKKTELETALPEELEKGDAVSKEEVGMTAGPKEEEEEKEKGVTRVKDVEDVEDVQGVKGEATDGKKASESVED